MVYSASSARTLLAGQGDGTMYLVKYLSYGALGFVALHVATRVSLDWVRKITPVLLAVAFFLCVLVKVPGIGVEVNGATRWLGAGPLQFQPSELMKLALVLYAVHLIALRPQLVQNLREVASPLLLVTGAAAVLIGSQPDLGTALVISFAMAALLVAAGMPMRILG